MAVRVRPLQHEELRNRTNVAYRRIHTRLTFLRPQRTEQMTPPIAFETARTWVAMVSMRGLLVAHSIGCRSQLASMSSPGDSRLVNCKEPGVDRERNASRFGARVSWPRSKLKQEDVQLLPQISPAGHG